MLYELTKGEKKVARAAIDKGLEASFKEGMENFEAIIKNGGMENLPLKRKPTMHCIKLLIKKTPPSATVITA